MSLHLDERQRAMLAEMHIRVWPARAEHPAASGTAPMDATAPTPPSVQRQDLALAHNTPTPPTASHPPMARHPASAPLASAPVAATAPRPIPTAAHAPAPSNAHADDSAVQAQRDKVATLGWGELKLAVDQCQACALGSTRTQAVWGQGLADNPHPSDESQAPSGLGGPQADWLVVVAAPTAEDQAQGLPMVGDPGRLLDNILRAVGLQREGLGPLGHSVFITPALKCAPPQERNPQAAELDLCEPQLARQIALLRPKVIVAMGLVAAQSVLKHDAAQMANLPLGRLRAQVWQHQGIPVVVTYPSAYLMRNPADKAKAWADWCMARTLALGQTG